MSPALILALIQLATTLSPEVISLINNLIHTFNNSNAPEADKLKLLTDLVDSLKPLEPKV